MNANHHQNRRRKSENERQIVQTTFTPTELEKIDEWGFARRIRNQSEALRQLVHTGLAGNRQTEKENGDEACGLGNPLRRRHHNNQ